jgi:hypothetical protein
MSFQSKFNILLHYSLLNDIILFGKTEFGESKKMYFICTITTIQKKKSTNSLIETMSKSLQSEASILIKGNNNLYYYIQVAFIPREKIIRKTIQQKFIESLKKLFTNSYNNLCKNNDKIKQRKNKFIYSNYNIPLYIWCIVVGMITAES